MATKKITTKTGGPGIPISREQAEQAGLKYGLARAQRKIIKRQLETMGKTGREESAKYSSKKRTVRKRSASK